MKGDVAWACLSHLRKQIVGCQSSQFELVSDSTRPVGGRVDLPNAVEAGMLCGAVLV